MSILWKLLLGVGIALPISAYVLGSLVASADEPAPREPDRDRGLEHVLTARAPPRTAAATTAEATTTARTPATVARATTTGMTTSTW